MAGHGPLSGSQLLSVLSQENGRGGQGTEAGRTAVWTAVSGLVLTAELVPVREQNPGSPFTL